MTAQPTYLRRGVLHLPARRTLLRASGVLAARLVPWALLGSLLLLLSACGDPTGPVRQPPYIAIIAIVSAPNGTAIGTQYIYRVNEISGTLKIDETFRVTPSDTVIVPVKPATYQVTLRGLPSQCRTQGGTDLYVRVPEGANTAVVRYLISCDSQITVSTATDGANPDPSFIYDITGPGTDRVGILASNDTLRVDGLVTGSYTVSLRHVASNCVVTSNGGPDRHVVVTDTRATKVDFRVICSQESERPQLLFFAASYHDGTSGFMFRATDPNHDIERYAWDITDCHGASVLPQGGRLRRGLSQDRTAGQDTITVFGAIELGFPDSALAGRCTSIRIDDENGNTTPVTERPIPSAPRLGPVPAVFNARFITTASLGTTLHVADPGFTGVFAAALLRDGVLSTPDGLPDLGVFNTVGYENVALPTVPLGGSGPQYYDYYAVIVYLFDTQGNFSRQEDDDLFN